MGARDDNAQLIPRATRVIPIFDNVTIDGETTILGDIIDVGGYNKATLFYKWTKTGGSDGVEMNVDLSPLGGSDFDDLDVRIATNPMEPNTTNAVGFQAYEVFQRGKFARAEIAEIGDNTGTVNAYAVLQP